MDWITKNPATFLKRVRVEAVPTDYFTKEEFRALVDATHAYGNWRGGHDFEHRQDRLRALILLMRWSGLAIKDAVTLERQRISDDGNLFLYRAKTGVPVYVPLPPDVHSLLCSLPNANPHYFFWSGNGDTQTCKRGWTRSLALLFKIAALKNPNGTLKRCHSHMFRDTFAVELLLAGVPIDQVSLLVSMARGNQSSPGLPTSPLIASWVKLSAFCAYCTALGPGRKKYKHRMTNSRSVELG